MSKRYSFPSFMSIVDDHILYLTIVNIYHPEWLANPVLVQKKNNNEWRVRRLHWSKQALPKGSFRATPHWSSNRLHGRMRPVILPRLLFRLSSDRLERRRPNQDGIHHPLRGIRLQDHVLWVEECWCYLPMCDTAVLCWSATSQCWSLCWRRRCQNQDSGSIHSWSGGNFQ